MENIGCALSAVLRSTYQAEEFPILMILTAEFLKNLHALVKNNCRQSTDTGRQSSGCAVPQLE